jgi:hypothetical protein
MVYQAPFMCGHARNGLGHVPVELLLPVPFVRVEVAVVLLVRDDLSLPLTQVVSLTQAVPSTRGLVVHVARSLKVLLVHAAVAVVLLVHVDLFQYLASLPWLLTQQPDLVVPIAGELVAFVEVVVYLPAHDDPFSPRLFDCVPFVRFSTTPLAHGEVVVGLPLVADFSLPRLHLTDLLLVVEQNHAAFVAFFEVVLKLRVQDGRPLRPILHLIVLFLFRNVDPGHRLAQSLDYCQSAQVNHQLESYHFSLV